MRLATNPIVLRMALVFVAAGFAFIVGLLLMRRMRRSISEEGSFSDTPSSVGVREFPAAHISRGDPATEAAET